MSTSIVVRPGPDEHLIALLKGHPHVVLEGESKEGALEFVQNGTWHRRIRVGAGSGLRGLVEMMDNNPIVCADELSVPDPASTLALIAVGPLIRAGILFEPPSLLFSFEAEEAQVDSYLETEGWRDGATVGCEAMDLGGVLALTAMSAIKTPENLDDIDDLYAEAFGRSFFVREDEDSEWHAKLVLGKPQACFRMRISAERPTSLLTVQVMADRNGKCGAAQVVHAMNVMAGFEESVGIA